jgi:hypothetical protein
MKIYKDKDNKNLIISIPLKQMAHNPYDETYEEEIDNIIGVIAGNEYGFCNLIDMSYAGKDSQIGSWFVKFDEIWNNAVNNRENKQQWFMKLCKKLNIDFFVYPVCSKCKKVIYGCFTIDRQGKDLCFDCEKD